MVIEDTVTHLLVRSGTALRNLLEDKARGVGLHSGQILALFELWKEDGLRQVDLASRLGVSAATVNKTLGGLLEADLVEREKFENDARSTRIVLTPKGRAIRRSVEDLWSDLEARTTGGLTDAEVTMLRQLLPRLMVEIM